MPSAPLLAAALAFAAGLLLALRSGAPGAPACLGLSLACLLLPVAASRQASRLRPTLIAACILLSLFLSGWAAGQVEHRPPPGLDSHPALQDLVDTGMGVRLEGRVRGLPERRDDHLLIHLEVHAVEGRGVGRIRGPQQARLAIRGTGGPAMRLLPGDRLQLSATLWTLRDFANPGVSGRSDALRRRGVALVGSVKSPRLVQVLAAGPPRPERWLAASRLALGRRLDQALERCGAVEKERGVLAALLLGQRSGLDPDARRQLGEAGTFHLLAISGMHVGMLAWMLLQAARWAGMGPRLSSALVLLALPAYVALTGMRPSAARAAWMAAAILCARLADRPARPRNALGLAALAGLLADPAALLEPGFQLSFAAAASIVEFTGRLQHHMPPPLWLGRGLAASIASTAGVAPLLARIAHRLAPIGVVANLAAVPLAGATLAAGLTALALETAVSGLGTWAAHAALAAVRGILGLSTLMARIPGGNWASPGPDAGTLGAYYLLLACLAAPLPRATRRAALGCFVLAAGAVAAGAPGSGPDTLQVHLLDVAQGDAVLVQSPGGVALLVDGGGLPRTPFDVGERVVAPAAWALGVRRLDLVVATHVHRDHLGGLPSVVRLIPTAEVWVPAGASLADHGDGRALLAACRRRGVPVRPVHRGIHRRLGDLEVEVLHPARGSGTTDPNRASLVLRLTFGRRCVLLTGDAGRDVEEALLAAGEPGSCDILKVGHHGSRSSTTPPFLRQVRPRYACISVGRGNPWGHPHPEVLEALRRAGSRTFRTDRHGRITLETDGEWIRWSVSDLPAETGGGW